MTTGIKFTRRFYGAFRFEERHLKEIDEIFARFVDGRTSVEISLSKLRSFKADTLSAINSHSIIDRLQIKSIDANRYAIDSAMNASCYLLLSDALLKYPIVIGATGDETSINAFEHAFEDLQKRCRLPYWMLFLPFIDVAAGLVFAAILFFGLSHLTNIAGPRVIILAGLSVSFGQGSISVLKLVLPRLVVNIGEGSRTHDRLMAPWRYLIPRVSWAIIGVVFLALVGWLAFK